MHSSNTRGYNEHSLDKRGLASQMIHDTYTRKRIVALSDGVFAKKRMFARLDHAVFR